MYRQYVTARQGMLLRDSGRALFTSALLDTWETQMVIPFHQSKLTKVMDSLLLMPL